MIKRSLLGWAKIGFVLLLGANSIIAARWDEIHPSNHGWLMILSVSLFIAALELWSYWGLSILREPEMK